jgi:hypothetical protein
MNLIFTLICVDSRLFTLDTSSVNNKRHRPLRLLTGDFNASPQDSSLTFHSAVLKALDFQVLQHYASAHAFVFFSLSLPTTRV